MYVYGQLLRAAAETLTSDPSTTNDKFVGRLWYNTVTGLLKFTDASNIIKALKIDTSISFALTNSMSATNITGMTVDSALYSSMVFEVEIQRSTTIFVNQTIILQRQNGAWVLVEGPFLGIVPDVPGTTGLTWSVTESLGIAQVQIASDSSGTGTLKWKKGGFDV